MKIIKFPSETKITCKCGCEFEFATCDIRKELNYAGTLENPYIYNVVLYVKCPFCDKVHIIKEYLDENTSD